ncbi:MAG: hypothetical protein H0U75_04745 [Legionella sp.]|nr:hypothetical protein [Legionella sp.]
MTFDFFQTLPLPSDRLVGFYNYYLVLLSFFVSIAASYIALDFAGQLRNIKTIDKDYRTSKWFWLTGGSTAMGAGIWSMHFIGMLSFNIPGLTLAYDIYWTIFSLIIAIVASSFALYLFQISIIRIEHYIAGGIILGLGIASMHYTGMEALLISLHIRYLPLFFFLSILIAILASIAAIWLSIQSYISLLKLRNKVKLCSAIIMGIAICGMHYTGMAASVLTPLCRQVTRNSSQIDPVYLAAVVATITFVILSIALFASTYKEGKNQKLIEMARQIGMAEISASVLHSVGNILNSVKTSVHALTENTQESKIDRLGKICAVLNEHKHDLSAYLEKDAKGKQTIEFLDALAEYLKEEQKNSLEELTLLNKNILLIQNTISTQQFLTKTKGLEDFVSINNLLDEALLITNLDSNSRVTLKKQYGKLKPIYIDKLSFLQVVINILNNAKQSVLESINKDKMITITTTSLIKNKIKLEITDNGIGISPQNIDKVFIYGFTTKKTGHGFGLHTSANAIRNMGGSIEVVSNGLGLGATFIIEI